MFVTFVMLAAVIAATQLLPKESKETVRPVVTATPATPEARVPLFHSASGFDVVVPPNWTATDRSETFNRRSTRVLVLSNGPQPQSGADGLIRWGDLPDDIAVLELTNFSFPGLPGPSSESSFPLDWGTAQSSVGPDGALSPGLRFQYLLQQLMLTAHYGPAASAADRDTIREIVASIRPQLIPSSGMYRGWDVVGPLSTFPVGSVRHFDNPQYVGGFFLVRGEHSVFAHIDSAYQFMGAMKPCPIRYDALTRTFACDATADRWSRTGAQLTGGGLFGLAYHTAIVKDGLVLVGGGSTGGGGRPPLETDEFADPAGLPPVASSPTRAEILDRYSQITTTSPIERASAKLVTRADALASDVIRGAFIRSDIDRVWVVAFSGDVRFPGGGDVHGRWALFYVDAKTGGAITMTCCGSGDWPPGFDALPDLARSGN